MTYKNNKIGIGISMTPELRARLGERAKKEKRSLSNLVCYYLEEGLK